MSILKQVYFTSCERGVYPGMGFQTRAVSPGVTDTDLMILEQSSVYPLRISYEQTVDACPQILKHIVLSDQTHALMKVSYLGEDYSGRSGNYIAHSLVSPLNTSKRLVFFSFWNDWKITFSVEEGAQPSVPLPIVSANSLVEEANIIRQVCEFVTSQGKERLQDMIESIFRYQMDGRALVIRPSHDNALDDRELKMWITALHLSFPRCMESFLTFSTLVDDFGDCLCINGAFGQSAFTFNETERTYQFYQFDFHTSVFSTLDNCDVYSRQVAELFGDSELLLAFMSFVDQFDFSEPTRELNLVSKLFMHEERKYSLTSEDVSQIFDLFERNNSLRDNALLDRVFTILEDCLSGFEAGKQAEVFERLLTSVIVNTATDSLISKYETRCLMRWASILELQVAANVIVVDFGRRFSALLPLKQFVQTEDYQVRVGRYLSTRTVQESRQVVDVLSTLTEDVEILIVIVRSTLEGDKRFLYSRDHLALLFSLCHSPTILMREIAFVINRTQRSLSDQEYNQSIKVLAVELSTQLHQHHRSNQWVVRQQLVKKGPFHVLAIREFQQSLLVASQKIPFFERFQSQVLTTNPDFESEFYWVCLNILWDALSEEERYHQAASWILDTDVEWSRCPFLESLLDTMAANISFDCLDSDSYKISLRMRNEFASKEPAVLLRYELEKEIQQQTINLVGKHVVKLGKKDRRRFVQTGLIPWWSKHVEQLSSESNRLEFGKLLNAIDTEQCIEEHLQHCIKSSERWTKKIDYLYLYYGLVLEYEQLVGIYTNYLTTLDNETYEDVKSRYRKMFVDEFVDFWNEIDEQRESTFTKGMKWLKQKLNLS